MVQMDMQSREHDMKMIVLHCSEPVRQQTYVMIVDQRQSADDNAIRFLSGLLDERFTDQVAERFGTIGITSLFYVLIELGKKIGIDGYTDAAEIAHLLSG